MRNPLISIREFFRGSCSTATSGAIDEAQANILSMIRSASQDMLNLVNDLLDVSVIESGRLTLGIRRSSITKVLESRVKINTVTAEAKGIKIHRYFEDVSEGYFDPNRIAQVIDNLLSNAVKYSPHNSNIHVILVRDDLVFRVWVKDEGPRVV